MNEYYACICIREFPVQSLLRLRHELRKYACVVMEGEPPLQQVCAMTRQARALGIKYGMTQVEIETFSGVKVLVRSASEEAAMKALLLECAGGFSPRVEECSEKYVFLCVVDITGTEKLFGPAQILAEKLLAKIRELGFSACIAISRNFHAAVTLAKGLTPSSAIQLIAPGEECPALASLSLDVLNPSEEYAHTFALWGIRTLGMLAALPEKELVARLGQEGLRLLRLARGEYKHLFRPVEPAFSLAEHMQLDTPVEMLDSLLFVANLMLEQLVLRAATRALALASVRIQLALDGGATHTRTVQPALPTNDRPLWIKLLRLDLEAHPPQSAILAITLTAVPGKTSDVQLGLFSPQLPEPFRLDVTLARIRAIVGETHVGRAVLKDTHEPDAFRMEPFALCATQTSERLSHNVRPALRRFRSAVAIYLTLDGAQPKAFFFRERRYTVERAYGPWVSCGDWWNPSLWEWEQWDLVARASDNTVLCCCISREPQCGHWRMMALYD